MRATARVDGHFFPAERAKMRFRNGNGGLLKTVDLLNDYEDGKGDNQKLDNRIEKEPVRNDGYALCLCIRQRPCRRRAQRDKKSVKSAPPNMIPIGGIITFVTRDDTIFPKTAPMTTPTAISITLPCTANSLNSEKRFHLLKPLP